jgi:hypothetical protein
MRWIALSKKAEKGLRQAYDSLVELNFDVCFQQKRYPRVGVWLRYTGRGLWRAKSAYRRDRAESPTSRMIGRASPTMRK